MYVSNGVAAQGLGEKEAEPERAASNRRVVETHNFWASLRLLHFSLHHQVWARIHDAPPEIDPGRDAVVGQAARMLQNRGTCPACLPNEYCAQKMAPKSSIKLICAVYDGCQGSIILVEATPVVVELGARAG